MKTTEMVQQLRSYQNGVHGAFFLQAAERLEQLQKFKDDCAKGLLAGAITRGVLEIAEERWRQIDELGYVPAHDDGHAEGELALAAACYAVFGLGKAERVKVLTLEGGDRLVDAFPWEERFDKRGRDPRIRLIVKAGALLAAEYDRLERGNREK